MEKYFELYKEGLSQEEFKQIIEKVAQASGDKIRTEYTTKIKELESQIPQSKSQQEIEFEERVKAIESKEKEFKLIETLQANELPTGLAKYLKGSEDLETFGKEFGQALNDYVLNGGFKPSTHKKTETTITKDKFKQMTYQQRVEFAESNPELFKEFSK